MMALNYSLLQPLRFELGRISVRPNEHYTPAEGLVHLARVGLSTEYGEGRNQRGEPVFRYRLEVTATSLSEEQAAPYEADVLVSGEFRVVRETDFEIGSLRRMAAFNGLAMLYGFARDIIWQNTTSGQFGPFILPALDLSAHADEVLAAIDSQMADESQVTERSASE